MKLINLQKPQTSLPPKLKLATNGTSLTGINLNSQPNKNLKASSSTGLIIQPSNGGQPVKGPFNFIHIPNNKLTTTVQQKQPSQSPLLRPTNVLNTTSVLSTTVSTSVTSINHFAENTSINTLTDNATTLTTNNTNIVNNNIKQPTASLVSIKKSNHLVPLKFPQNISARSSLSTATIINQPIQNVSTTPVLLQNSLLQQKQQLRIQQKPTTNQLVQQKPTQLQIQKPILQQSHQNLLQSQQPQQQLQQQLNLQQKQLQNTSRPIFVVQNSNGTSKQVYFCYIS